MRLFAEDRAGALLRTPTIHDLFNELHRRLEEEMPDSSASKVTAAKWNRLYDHIDALHHDYTELTS